MIQKHRKIQVYNRVRTGFPWKECPFFPAPPQLQKPRERPEQPCHSLKEISPISCGGDHWSPLHEVDVIAPAKRRKVFANLSSVRDHIPPLRNRPDCGILSERNADQIPTQEGVYVQDFVCLPRQYLEVKQKAVVALRDFGFFGVSFTHSLHTLRLIWSKVAGVYCFRPFCFLC